jgi:hypothetical protein
MYSELTFHQLVNNFPAFYETGWFIAAFTGAQQLSLSWASVIQSTPTHPTSWKFFLILSSHLRLGLPSGLFSSGLPTESLHEPLLTFIHATFPTHPFQLVLIQRIRFGEECKPWSSSLLTPNSFLSTSFSNTLNLYPSLNEWEQVSHPFKTEGKIIVLYICIFIFLDSKLEGQRFCNEW